MRPYRQLVKVTQQTLCQVEQVIPWLQKQQGHDAQQLAATFQHYLPLVHQVINADDTTRV
jgi:hypothetical protein